MNIKKLSNTYCVKRLNEDDTDIIYDLCKENTKYYEYYPPFVTLESIKEDLKALPPRKTYQDKYYLGYFKDDELIAVMDLILKYPQDNEAFIGFFMVKKNYQRKHIGKVIISELSSYLKQEYDYIRLAWLINNIEAQQFWKSNGFVELLKTKTSDGFDIQVGRKILQK